MRRFTRRTRRRRLIVLVSSGLVAALVLGVVALTFSPLLALRKIEVDGAAEIGAQRVEQALRGQLGRPLALVGASEVKSALSRFPRVRTFSIETLPPGTLIVRIVERTPIGVIQDGSTYRTVDAARVTLQTESSRPAGLPLIHVAPASDTSRAAVFQAVAQVLSSLPATVLGKVDTITASTPDNVSFTLGSRGPTVVWGTSADSNLKAADLSRLMALPESQGATEFDVSAPYSVVVR